VLTAERVSRGWVLYLRTDGCKKVYVKKLNGEQVRDVVEGDIDKARLVGHRVIEEKYGRGRIEFLGFNNPKREQRKFSSLSLGVWVEIGKLYREGFGWRREGILIIRRKKGNQWAYYLVEKPKSIHEYYVLIERVGHERAKTFRKHYYVVAVPKEHLPLIVARKYFGKINKEDLERIFNDLRRKWVFVMRWNYVEPHRFKSNEANRPSMEDEGIIGELQSKAEDYGWGEVEEELAENGDRETIEELREEGYLD